eukprot:gene19348-6591_t
MFKKAPTGPFLNIHRHHHHHHHGGHTWTLMPHATVPTDPSGEIAAARMNASHGYVINVPCKERPRGFLPEDGQMRSATVPVIDAFRISYSQRSCSFVLFRAVDGALLYTLYGHTAEINDVSFHQSGQYVLTCSEDGTVKVWLTASGELAQSFDCATHAGKHAVSVSWAGYTANGQTVMARTGSTMTLLDTATNASLGVLHGHNARINFVDSSADQLCSVSGNGEVKFWDAAKIYPTVSTISGRRMDCGESTKLGFHPQVHDGGITSISFSIDGTFMSSTSVDGRLKTWNMVDEAATLQVSREAD